VIKTKVFMVLLLVLGFPLVYNPTFYETIKLKTFDAFVAEKQPSNYFSILNITEEDVEQEGGYPFPRKRLAEIQNELINKGALGVGWVIAFPQPDRFGGDLAFAESLASAPSVLASFENDNGEYPLTTGTVILGEDRGGFKAKGVVQNTPLLREAAYQGIAVAPTEVDQLVRRMPLLLRTPDGWVSAYGTEVLKVLTGSDTYLIKTSEAGIQEIRVKGLPPVKTDTLGRKWISWVKTPEFSLADIKNTDLIQDRFIFVGVTAKGVMPQIATPVGLMEPHKIQAALSESILIQDSPIIPDYALLAELGVYLVVVSLAWIFVVTFGVSSGLLFFFLLNGVVAGSGYYLIQNNLLIDVTWPLISGFIAGSVGFYLNFREQYKLRQEIKKQFEHYLDPRQVKRLQDNPELLVLGGETRYATFLFTDVRGFTAMSETLPPEQVTYIMNKALTAQQKAVQRAEGTVDKYIGDAMMAFWNAPLDQPAHETKALVCAKLIMDNMKELNVELKEEGLPSVEIGIGINSGKAVIGNMGSETRFDYTAIGDAVNVAARLESGTKDLGVNLLVGEDTARFCAFELKFVDKIKVKGKEKPLSVFSF
jgi:adenylate cyclase